MYKLSDLEPWNEARKMRKYVSALVSTFPKDEHYRLKDQLLRSSRSVSANIAEGFGRNNFKENIQFCRQARGSLYETLDHIICAYDEEIILEKELIKFKKFFDYYLKLIDVYIKHLKETDEKKIKPKKK